MNASFIDVLNTYDVFNDGEVKGLNLFTKVLISNTVILSRKEIPFVPRYLGYVIRLEPYFFQSTSLIFLSHENLPPSWPQ